MRPIVFAVLIFLSQSYAVAGTEGTCEGKWKGVGTVRSNGWYLKNQEIVCNDVTVEVVHTMTSFAVRSVKLDDRCAAFLNCLGTKWTDERTGPYIYKISKGSYEGELSGPYRKVGEIKLPQGGGSQPGSINLKQSIIDYNPPDVPLYYLNAKYDSNSMEIELGYEWCNPHKNGVPAADVVISGHLQRCSNCD